MLNIVTNVALFRMLSLYYANKKDSIHSTTRPERR